MQLKVIHGGKVDQGILNKVEMAFRAYDPCLVVQPTRCGQMPLTVEVSMPKTVN